MSFSLILDMVIVALLVPTIIFAVVLNNRLSALRKNRDDLARLVAAFNEATVRAESGIPRLRKTSEDAARTLEEQVERARVLRDDLAFMVERAEAMAARVEDAVRQGRGLEGRLPPAKAGGAASGAGAGSAAGAAMGGGHATAPSSAMAGVTTGALSGRPSVAPLSGLDIESAAAAADRARTMAAAQPGTLAGPPPLKAEPADRLMNPTVRDALRAARATPAPERVSERAPERAPDRTPERTPERTLERTLDRVSDRASESGVSPASRSGAPSLGAALAREAMGTIGRAPDLDDDGRSEAERELLRALQSAR